MPVKYRGTALRGKATAHPAQMEAVLFRWNPSSPRVAHHYLNMGERLGIRGDVAFAQALLETGYFRFTGVLQPWQHNYARLGADGPGEPGASFASPEEGVLAHLQHLYAYVTDEPLPPGMALVDPAFERVDRGSAAFVGDLSGKWSSLENYGEMIDRILADLLLEPVPGEPYAVEKAFLDADSPNRPGNCAPAGCWRGVQGVVIHRTARPRMDAREVREYFNRSSGDHRASTHFLIDDRAILQIIPIGEVAYHAEGKNLTHLGIHVCEHNWGTPAWDETYHRLVWLTARLVERFQLTLADVSGHFWWDPVNRPYDPTHLGWRHADGRATGLFDWNQFIGDVARAIAGPGDGPGDGPGGAGAPTEQPERIRIRVARRKEEDCTEGLLLGGTAYAPVGSLAACLLPGATVRWLEEKRQVLVAVPEPPRPRPAGDPVQAWLARRRQGRR